MINFSCPFCEHDSYIIQDMATDKLKAVVCKSCNKIIGIYPDLSEEIEKAGEIEWIEIKDDGVQQ